MIEHHIHIEDYAERQFRQLKEALETIHSSNRQVVEAICAIDDYTLSHEARQLTAEELIQRYQANFPDSPEPSTSRISKARVTCHAFRSAKKSWSVFDEAGFKDSEVLYYVGQALLPEVGKHISEVLESPENGGMPRSRKDAKAWLDMHKGKDPNNPTDRVLKQAQEVLRDALKSEPTPRQVRETVSRILLEKWEIMEFWLREEAGDTSQTFKDMQNAVQKASQA